MKLKMKLKLTECFDGNEESVETDRIWTGGRFSKDLFYNFTITNYNFINKTSFCTDLFSTDSTQFHIPLSIKKGLLQVFIRYITILQPHRD